MKPLVVMGFVVFLYGAAETWRDLKPSFVVLLRALRANCSYLRVVGKKFFSSFIHAARHNFRNTNRRVSWNYLRPETAGKGYKHVR